MKKISIVIPLYNEQDVIPELYKRVKYSLVRDFSNFDHEIIFVNDGSSDSTQNELEKIYVKDSCVEIIAFSRNFGHHIAITAGLDAASGDFVVLMDGDLQDQPEEIKKLYSRLQDGYDVVYGEQKEKKFSWFKRFCSYVFCTIIRLLIAENIIINTYIFRIMTKQVVQEVRKLHERQRYILGIIGWVGFKTASVSVIHDERRRGVTKYSLAKEIKLALDAIVSFSDYPLRMITRLGFILVTISLIAVSWLFVKRWLYGVGLLGWTSMMCAILFVGGMQLFVLGIVGEYIGRIYVEVKQRPLYIVGTRLLASKKQEKEGVDVSGASAQRKFFEQVYR